MLISGGDLKWNPLIKRPRTPAWQMIAVKTTYTPWHQSGVITRDTSHSFAWNTCLKECKMFWSMCLHLVTDDFASLSCSMFLRIWYLCTVSRKLHETMHSTEKCNQTNKKFLWIHYFEAEEFLNDGYSYWIPLIDFCSISHVIIFQVVVLKVQ